MSKRHIFGTQSHLNFRSQSGQVAVIVFLIMAVLLVIGLSLATRTSQEIELAGQQEDTTRVFNAAETGIEQALSDQSNFSVSTSTTKPIANLDTTQTSGTVTISPATGFENEFLSGETATVFTTGDTGNFYVWWHHQAASCNAAVLAITVYIKGATDENYTAEHYGVRPINCNSTGTNFAASDSSVSPLIIDGKTYQYRYRVPMAQHTRMVRIKPLRSATRIYIQASNGVLSQQLYNIRSEAQDSSTGTTEVRAIEVTRTRPAPPSVFDYALYSGGNLSK